jgi:Ca2+-transporting ATPase
MSSAGFFVLTGTLLSLVLITNIPAIADAFAFSPPSIRQWLLAFALGAGVLLLFMAEMLTRRKAR